MPTLFASLVPPLVFFERIKIIMAHRWLWYWQKRTNAFENTDGKSRDVAHTLIAVLAHCLCCAYTVLLRCCRYTFTVHVHSWLFACISNWKCFHNAYAVFMDESTVLVLRSYNHDIATIIRNQCVNVTATALQMPAKSQRQHWDAC